MRAGTMRDRVVIQQATNARDETNQAVLAYVDTDEIAAEIRPNNGSTRWFNESVISEATHVARIRWRRGLTTAHRLAWTNGGESRRILEIIAPPQNQDGHRRELLVACKETVAPAEGEG